MPELETEGEMTRGEVADFLREFADELDEGDRQWERIEAAEGDEYSDRTQYEERDDDHEAYGEDDELDEHGDRIPDEALGSNRLTLIVGGDSATVTVPETLEFDVEVESRSPMLSSDVKQEISFELSWMLDDEDVYEDASIQVE